MGAATSKVAIVLGSGAARGWAHIGVLRALQEEGIEPSLVCGSSIGAMVGAALAAKRLNEFEEWVRNLDQMDILSLLDRGLGDGGLINGSKLMDAYAGLIGNPEIENLDTPFVAVATDIESGREVWIKNGSAVAAVRASIAIPGIFSPVCIDDRWLVDGGLVNPVPVSTARALGAEVVIAVNLNGDLLGSPGATRRYARPSYGSENTKSAKGLFYSLKNWVKVRRQWPFIGKALFSGSSKDRLEPPGIVSMMADAIDVMQERITRARLAGEPPDIILSPKIGNIGMLEFDRADEVIQSGYESVQLRREEIRALTGR